MESCDFKVSDTVSELIVTYDLDPYAAVNYWRQMTQEDLALKAQVAVEFYKCGKCQPSGTFKEIYEDIIIEGENYV